MEAGVKNAPVLFKRIPDEPQHPAGFSVESSPDSEDFILFGMRLGQPDRGLHSLGTAAVKLDFIQTEPIQHDSP